MPYQSQQKSEELIKAGANFFHQYNPSSMRKKKKFGDIVLDVRNPQLFFEEVYKIDKNFGQYLHKYNWKVWNPTTNDKPNPKKENLIITVAFGEYEDIINYNGDLFESYAKKCNADFVFLTGRKQGWWGQEKFRIKPFVEAYKRTIFLDIDTVVRKETPNLFNIVPEDHVGIHDDTPASINVARNLWFFSEREKLLQSQNVKPKKHLHLLNTGVVVCSNQHASIWSGILKDFPGNHCDEQYWIEYQILEKYKVFLLPLRFNCQWWMINFNRTKEYSDIIHYANAPDRVNQIKKEVEHVNQSR